jgi:rhodanese-related sulfurtransferase
MFGLFKSKATTYKNISSEEFKQLMETHKDATLVDVRTSGEAAQGKIKGAKVINIMSPDFQSQLAKLPKDKPLLMYCRSGNRSASGCRVASELGFTEVYNLNSGVMGWKYGLV